MRLLQTILIGLLSSFSLSAWACSDLPNICEMHAQHHQQMQDYGRQAAENYYWQQQEQYEEQESRTYYSSYDPMQSRIQVATDLLNSELQKMHKNKSLNKIRAMNVISMADGNFFKIAQSRKRENIALRSFGRNKV